MPKFTVGRWKRLFRADVVVVEADGKIYCAIPSGDIRLADDICDAMNMWLMAKPQRGNEMIPPMKCSFCGTEYPQEELAVSSLTVASIANAVGTGGKYIRAAICKACVQMISEAMTVTK